MFLCISRTVLINQILKSYFGTEQKVEVNKR